MYGDNLALYVALAAMLATRNKNRSALTGFVAIGATMAVILVLGLPL